MLLGSPKDAATTLTIDGTSQVHGYACTVAKAACKVTCVPPQTSNQVDGLTTKHDSVGTVTQGCCTEIAALQCATACASRAVQTETKLLWVMMFPHNRKGHIPYDSLSLQATGRDSSSYKRRSFCKSRLLFQNQHCFQI